MRTCCMLLQINVTVLLSTNIGFRRDQRWGKISLLVGRLPSALLHCTELQTLCLSPLASAWCWQLLLLHRLTWHQWHIEKLLNVSNLFLLPCIKATSIWVQKHFGRTYRTRVYGASSGYEISPNSPKRVSDDCCTQVHWREVSKVRRSSFLQDLGEWQNCPNLLDAPSL